MLGTGNRRFGLKVPLISLALCMFLIGTALVVRAATTHDTPRRAEDAQVPATPAQPSTSDSASPTASASPTGPSTAEIDQAVAGRAAALADLATKAQQLSSKRRNARPVARLTFAQFNVQGATHRGGIGTRTAIARDLLNRYNVGVAALQEFTSSQQGSFAAQTGNAWGCYPCGNGPNRLDGEDSVVWRKDRYQVLKLETRPYPYFGGSTRNMPRVLLRDKASGASFYVTSYHNPANVFGNQGKWRSIAVSRQIADANAVRAATKIPLIVSGDMNDRAAYFCRMGPGTGMHSADGSSASGGCRVAGSPWIDWIMGTPDVAFSGYVRDNSATVRRSSDHPILVTQVKITGQPGEGKYGSDRSDG